MRKWLFRSENDLIDVVRKWSESVYECNKKQTECDMLYKALISACNEIYKFTGDNSSSNPSYFIDKVKRIYGYF